MESLEESKPAIVSLKAINVPEKPMAVKAQETLGANEKVFRIDPTCFADNPAAVPVELLSTIEAVPG